MWGSGVPRLAQRENQSHTRLHCVPCSHRAGAEKPSGSLFQILAEQAPAPDTGKRGPCVAGVGL